MVIKIFREIWRFVWSMVWEISETLGIGLGKMAPWVFSQIIRKREKKIK